MDRSRRRILLLHGDPAARADLRELLSDSGYAVAGEAADGQSALGLARTLQPDLVLLEVRLLGKNGIWVAGALYREHLAPAILMADSAEPALVARAVRCGVYACVVKPFGARSLVPVMELAMERFAHATRLREEASAVRRQIDDQKLLERAKAALNHDLGLNETDAALRLEALAGKSGKTLTEVAGAIVIAAQTRH